MTIAFDFDQTYEVDGDGELGALMSLDARGHLDDVDVDLFMVTAVAEEFDWRDEPITFGAEVEHLWRTEHPLVVEDDEDMAERWTFSYSPKETSGSVAVTRFQFHGPWATRRSARLPISDPRSTSDDGWMDTFPIVCVNHPLEVAVTGMPAVRFRNPLPEQLINGYVHFCRPCADAADERIREATRRGMAPHNVKSFLTGWEQDEIATSGERVLLRSDVQALVDGDITAELTKYLESLEPETEIVASGNNHSRLNVRDLRYLVEGVRSEAA